MAGSEDSLHDKRLKGLQLLAELSHHAAIIGEMGNHYTQCYLYKGEYRETPETGLQWVERSTWTIHKKFHEVLKCLCKLAKENIKSRDLTFSTVHEKVKEDRFWPYFKGAIGAIDGSHIPVQVPAEDVINHTCRHGYTSQNVLAICDFDMRFIFAVAGWAGSAHDTRILNHALTNFTSFPRPPAGKYYFVDSGYPNRLRYLAPFKESTYHIPEFRHRSGPPQRKYEMFNFLHSPLRNVIERAFGVLKEKWRILKGIPSFDTRTQKHIILVCMALHNFIRDNNLSDKEFDKCDADEDYLVQEPTTHIQGDDDPEGQHEQTMNNIRDGIANAFRKGKIIMRLIYLL